MNKQLRFLPRLSRGLKQFTLLLIGMTWIGMFHSTAQVSVVNYGFEDGSTDAWLCTTATYATISSNSNASYVRTGTYSLHIQVNQSSSTTTFFSNAGGYYFNTSTTGAASSSSEWVLEPNNAAANYSYFICWIYATATTPTGSTNNWLCGYYEVGTSYNSASASTAIGSNKNGTTTGANTTYSPNNVWQQFYGVTTTTYSTGRAVNPLLAKQSKFTNDVWMDDGILYTSTQSNVDIVPPNAPTALALSGSVSGSSATLGWTNSTDVSTGTCTINGASVNNSSCYTGVQNSILLRAPSTATTAAAPGLRAQAVYAPASASGNPGGPYLDTTGNWTVISTNIGASSTTYNDVNVPAGTYVYALIHRDMAYNYSLPDTTTTANAVVYSANATAPVLTAVGGSSSVDNTFTVTFPFNPTFAKAITTGTATLGTGAGSTLTYGTDYTVNTTVGYGAGSNTTITFTPTSGGAANLHTPGTYTLTVTGTGYAAATVSKTLTVGAATKLSITTQPTAPAADGAVLATQPVVVVQDQYANTVTTSSASVTAAYSATSSSSWTLSGTTAKTASSGVATFTNLVATGASAVTSAYITFTSSGLTSVTSTPAFSIPAPAASSPTLTAASGATVDNSFSITFPHSPSWISSVTSVQYGSNTLSSSTDYSFISGASVDTLRLIPAGSSASGLRVPGTNIVTVLAAGYPSDTVSQTVAAGVGTHLAITTQPTAPAADAGALATQPVVAIEDQYNNITTSTATVSAAVGAGTWTLGGTTSVSAVSGTATFSGLTATDAATVTGATIAFSSSGITGITSNTFTIPGPAAPTLTATTSPTSVDNSFTVTFPTNSAFATAIGTGSITIGGSTLTPTTDYTVSGNNTITFTPTTGGNTTLHTPGAYTIVVNATGYGSGSVSQTLTIGAASKIVITTQPTAPATNGATFATQPVAKIEDQFGNIETGSSATVTAAATQGTWTLGGTTGVAASSGVATFSGLTATSSAIVYNASITFSATGVSSAISNTFTVPYPTITDTLSPGTTNSVLAWTGGSGSGNFGSYSPPSNGITKKFMVGGANLTGSITVNVPGGFKISTTSPGSAGFSTGPTTKTFTTSGGTVVAGSDTVYIHPDGTGATYAQGYGVVNANITLTNSGAATVTIPVTDTILATLPTTTGYLTTGTITGNSITLNYTDTGTNTGSKLIIVMSAGGNVSYTPTNGLPSTGVNSDFSVATDQGSGNKIIYDGSGSTTAGIVTVTGLTGATKYYFKVYDYNVVNANSQAYNVAVPAIDSATTAISDYYSASTGDIDLLATWGSNTDGSGSNPTSFTTSGLTFHLANGNPGNVSGAWTVANLSVGSATSLSSNTTVSGTLTLSGKLTVGTNTLTIADFSGSSSNSLAVGSGSTVTTTGALTGSLYFDPSNNTIGTLNIGGNATLGNALNVTAGSTPGTVNVTAGTLTTGGFLTLRSNSSGTARIGTYTGTISGNVNAERYIQAQRGYRILSHPFSADQDIANLGAYIDLTDVSGLTGGNASICTSSNGSVFSYVPGTGWSSITAAGAGTYPAASSSTTHGNGVLVFIRGQKGEGCNAAYSSTGGVIDAPTVVTTGAVNKGSTSLTEVVPHDASPSTTAHGWNLISNPLPSEIDASLIGTTSGAIDDDIYLINPAGQGLGATTNGTQYLVVSISGSGNSIPIIPMNSGFLAHNSSTSTDAVLNFPESCKTSSSSNGNNNVFKTTGLYPILELTAMNGTAMWDNWQLRMKSMASQNAGDNGDISKLSNTNFSLYSYSTDNYPLARDARDADSIADGEVIPLAVSSSLQTTYNLVVTNYTLPLNKDVYLHDKYTNTYVKLSNGVTYPLTISSDPASTGKNRLELLFNDVNNNTGVSNVTGGAGMTIVPNPATSNITVSYASIFTGDKLITIVNSLGQVMKQVITADNQTTIPVDQLASGMYIIKTTINGRSVTERFIKN